MIDSNDTLHLFRAAPQVTDTQLHKKQPFHIIEWSKSYAHSIIMQTISIRKAANGNSARKKN